MQPQTATYFFLGSNTAKGFHSLYHPFTTLQEAGSLTLLKGGSACGRWAFLERVGRGMYQNGHSVTYIRCCSDPEALDGILVEELGLAIFSGTSPHLAEPEGPSGMTQYLNLGEGYDSHHLQNMTATISSHTGGYATCYDRACRCLSGATALSEDGPVTLSTPSLLATMAKRGRGILSRECMRTDHEVGHVTQRFLSCVTAQGVPCYFDTVDTLCQKVYVVSDRYGLAHPLFQQLCDGFVASGHDVITCLHPLLPKKIAHLIIPSLSLAFVTSTPTTPYEKKPYRHIRVDAMVDPDLLHQHKGRLRFASKCAAALVEEAVLSLGEAKWHYDQLEGLYYPYVNFESLYAQADLWVTEQLSHLDG